MDTSIPINNEGILFVRLIDFIDWYFIIDDPMIDYQILIFPNYIQITLNL